VSYFIALKEALSGENGRFYVNGIIHFPDVPFLSRSSEATIVFKPGYKLKELPKKQFTVKLEKIPTLLPTRGDALKRANDNFYVDKYQSSDYQYMLSTEKEFLDIMEDSSENCEFWRPFISEITDSTISALIALTDNKVGSPVNKEEKVLGYIRTLTNSSMPVWRRTEAMGRLADTGDPRAFDMVFAALGDKELRLAAVRQLFKFHDPRADDFFLTALDDDDAEVRRLAAINVDHLRDKKTIRAFKAHLSASDENVRFVSKIGLGFYNTQEGQQEISSLINDLSNQSQWEKASSTLARIRQPAVDKLIVSLKAGNKQVACRSANLLRYFKDARVIDPLIENLSLRDERGGAAAYALTNYHEPRVAKALVDALKYKELNPIITNNLSQMGSIAIEYLVSALGNTNVEVRRSAEQILCSIPDSRSVDALCTTLKDHDIWVRRYAVRALVQIRDPGSVPALFSALHDQDEEVRLTAASGLTHPESLRDRQRLYGYQHHTPYMYESKVSVRGMCATLTRNRPYDEAAIKQLISGLKDDDPYIRWRSAWCLGKRREVGAVEPLTELLKDKESQVRWMAINALANIRDQRAADKILALSQDSDIGIKEKATNALDMLSPVEDEEFVQFCMDFRRKHDNRNIVPIRGVPPKAAPPIRLK